MENATIKYAPVPTRLGLIAGQGDFPVLVARAARGAGVNVTGFGLRGYADDALRNECDAFMDIDIGRADESIRKIRGQGIQHVIMAGRVPHSTIFKMGGFDARALKMLARAVTRKADSLLGLIVDELGREGIEVLDSSLFLKSLMPEPGYLAECIRNLDAREKGDLAFAYPLAKAIAGHDIGQTIVVKDKAVVAVEALEGTDKCIRRAGELAGPGCLVVKVSKPRQDLRFDIPVAGWGTLESMAAAGASALAISARESLVFDRERVLDQAQRLGMSLLAVDDDFVNSIAPAQNT